MLVLHIDENEDEINKIMDKIAMIKRDYMQLYNTAYEYCIKVIRFMDADLLYTIVCGKESRYYMNPVELGFEELEEHSWDFEYEILRVKNERYIDSENISLLTESEKRYLLNKINLSELKNKDWFLDYFVQKKLGLRENQDCLNELTSKYNPIYISERYKNRFYNIILNNQISFLKVMIGMMTIFHFRY